jgi:hypothetical protein
MTDDPPTGAPIGGAINLPGSTTPLAKYDPATRQIRAMTPPEQRAVAASYPKGPAPAGMQQQFLDDAAQAQNSDPNAAQNVKQSDLNLEHPNAFAALRGGRPGFRKPRKPGPMRR